MRVMLEAALLATAMLLAPASARADASADARLAQALFEEARVLMEQKRFAEACPKLAESQRLDPGGGTLLNLAVCHAGEGKIATALVEYHDALAVATRDGRKDREAIARASIEALERDVPRITVSVRDPVPDLEVKLDSLVLPRAAWGVATPVDPGTHVVVASVPGRPATSIHVDVAVGERKVVEVPLAAPSAAAPPAANEPEARTRANPAFFVALGLTLAAGATAAATGALAVSESSTADDGCIPDRSWCRDAASRDAYDAARTLAWVSTGALVVAGVGAVVLLVTPSRIRERPGAAAHPAAPRRPRLSTQGLSWTF